MKELSKNIELLLEIMNKLIIGIMEEDEKAEKIYLPQFTDAMLNTFPRIISAYTLPEFEEVKQDMQYWTGQVKRILEALESRDHFLLIDVLKFETMENLEIFKEMIGGME